MQGPIFVHDAVQSAWRPRYAILKDKTIHLFISSDDRRQLATIDLRGLTDYSADAPTGPEGSGGPTLVMHVSGRPVRFLCENEATRDRWLKALASTEVFGQPLQVVAERKEGSHDRGVPLILLKCLAYLNTHGLNTENLYRIPGDSSQIKALRARFNQDDTAVDLNVRTTPAGPPAAAAASSTQQQQPPTDVHAVASLVKLYLRELPEPLLPATTLARMQAAMNLPEAQRITTFRQELAMMPHANLRTLRKLLLHLAKLLENGERTRLSSNVLAALFAPTLARSQAKGADTVSSAERAVVETLLTHTARLFEDADSAARAKEAAAQAAQEQERNIPVDVVVVRPKASGGDVGDRMQVQASMQTTVKEFTADLLAHLKAREPEDNYESYALFEVLPVGERVVDDYEKVVPRLNVGMPDPMGALVFKLDDARMVALPLAPPTYLPDVQGWLYKQGVSVKTWKRRFCILRAEGIFYYKDPKNIAPGAELGSIPFHGLAICSMFGAQQKLPTQYGFSIRRRWPRSPDDVFTRIFAADTEQDRMLWMAALRFAKNPSKYWALMQDAKALEGADPIVGAGSFGAGVFISNAGLGGSAAGNSNVDRDAIGLDAEPATASGPSGGAVAATAAMATFSFQSALKALQDDDGPVPAYAAADDDDDDERAAPAPVAVAAAAGATAAAATATAGLVVGATAAAADANDSDDDDDDRADREQEVRELQRLLAEQEELRRRAEALKQKLATRRATATAVNAPAAAVTAGAAAAEANTATAGSVTATTAPAATDAAPAVERSAALVYAMEMLDLATGQLPPSMMGGSKSAAPSFANNGGAMRSGSVITDLLLLEVAERELYSLQQSLATDDPQATATATAAAAAAAATGGNAAADDDDDDDGNDDANGHEAASLPWVSASAAPTQAPAPEAPVSDDDDEDDEDALEDVQSPGAEVAPTTLASVSVTPTASIADEIGAPAAPAAEGLEDVVVSESAPWAAVVVLDEEPLDEVNLAGTDGALRAVAPATIPVQTDDSDDD